MSPSPTTRTSTEPEDGRADTPDGADTDGTDTDGGDTDGGGSAGETDAGAPPSRSGLQIRPPRIATGVERSATPLELFYDLAYVVVAGELAVSFVEHQTWHGLAVFAGLFTVLWSSWVSTTLYANRFDTDDAVFRLAQLLSTLAIAGCGAAASDAVGSTAVQFAACFLLARVVLVGLYLRAWRHVPQARSTLTVYVATASVAAALWAVSLAVPAPGRYVLWAVGVAVEGLGPLLATRTRDVLPVHMAHLPERFGLFVILVLGEVVTAVVTGVHDAHWARLPVAVAVAGFVLAGALWWSYFDVTSASSSAELQEEDAQANDDRPDDDEDDGSGEDEGTDEDGEDDGATDERHDLFAYGHLPLTLGIITAGVGLEELVLHPAAGLPSAAGWLAAGGTALYLLGAALIVGGTHRRLGAAWPWPTAAVPLVLAVALAGPPALVAVCLLAAVAVVVAVTGSKSRVSDQGR